jgi:hypothetical protein
MNADVEIEDNPVSTFDPVAMHTGVACNAD